MADTSNQASAATGQGSPQAPAKVKKEKKVKNPRTKPSHPPTSEMVINAIKGLKERGGSSLQAIKKYVAANYKVDADKVAPFIKKYLKTAVASGSLVQTKGKGASGSFRLGSGSVQGGEKKKSSVKKAKKTTAGEKPKAAVKKSTPKTKKEKKAPSAPKAKKPAGAAKKKAAAVAKPKSPSKAKKTKTGPTKKPKAPKPKTAKKKATTAAKKTK